MKKKIALALCLVLLVSMVFAGCGADPKKDLLGAWEAKIDLSEMMQDQMAEGDEALAGYFEDIAFSMQWDLTFHEDNTFALGVNIPALEKSFQELIPTMVAGMEQYFQDMIDSLELEMTVEEVLEMSGIASLTEMIEELMAVAMEELSSDDMNLSGTYAVKDGKLTLTVDGETEEVPYTLVEGVLTLTIPEMEDLLGATGAMEFKKVS